MTLNCLWEFPTLLAWNVQEWVKWTNEQYLQSCTKHSSTGEILANMSSFPLACRTSLQQKVAERITLIWHVCVIYFRDCSYMMHMIWDYIHKMSTIMQRTHQIKSVKCKHSFHNTSSKMYTFLQDFATFRKHLKKIKKL